MRLASILMASMVCLCICCEFLHISFCVWIYFLYLVWTLLYCLFGFILGYDSAHEAQDMEEDVDVLDNEEGEPLEEFFYEPVKITEGVRRCNRRNGRWWVCSQIAHPGYTLCLHHMKNLPETAGPSSLEALSGPSAVRDDDVGPA